MFVHVVFSCVHKLIAFEFKVLILVVCSRDICSVFLESFLGNDRVVMPSLPTNKTCQQWIKTYFWLNFDADGKMLRKLCCWWAEQNGTVNSSSSSKIAQGSLICQLSSIKYHDASKPHAAAKTAKEDFDARKARFSGPLRKVVQEILPDSGITKSMQQMNNKDQ